MIKKLCFLVIFYSYPFLSFAQDCDTPNAHSFLNGNLIRANIRTGGDLFWDGNDAAYFTDFDLVAENNSSTIFCAGLWLGGLDEGGNLHLTAQSYGASSNIDYSPGPLNPFDGTPYYIFCPYFDKVWKVSKEDIENHLDDFLDNNQIDNPISSIFQWPGNGNPFSFEYNLVFVVDSEQGWAPFFDQNNDGIYDPSEGDYPHPSGVIPNLHPAEMTWCVFHDNRPHLQTAGLPLKVEVQLTAWSFDCNDQYILRNTVFTSHKIINRSQQNYDSLKVGMFVDLSIGCYLDDLIGSAPELNTFFAYNGDEADGNNNSCNSGVAVYMETPPVQTVTFLNQSMAKFIYINNGSVSSGPQGTTDPATYQEFHHLLNGRWKDGSPLTEGGEGYHSLGLETNFAFPDPPNDIEGWSMQTAYLSPTDLRGLGILEFETLEPGEAIQMDIGYMTIRRPNFSILENVNRLYYDVPILQQMYNQQFNNYCEGVFTSTELPDNEVIITVYPNPVRDKFHITSNGSSIDFVELLNNKGVSLIKAIPDQGGNLFLSLADLPVGLFFLKVVTDKGWLTRKIIKQ